MTIAEMHVWFRQYAQQMGLQNVRAILPEQIDLLINTSITDVVNQLVRENLGVVNDRIVTDNSKIGQINSFRTLYKVAELPITKFVEAPAITKQYELTLSADVYHSDDPEIEPETYRYGLALCYVDEDNHPYVYNYNPNKTDVAGVKEMIQNFAGTTSSAAKYIKKIEVIQYTPAIYVDENNKQDGYLCINVTYSGPFNFWISDYNRGEDASDGVWWDPNTISETWDDVKLHRLFEFTEDSSYTGLLKGSDIIDNFFYLVDFAINYKKAENGYNVDDTKEIEYVSGSDAFVTNYFPVRLIDDSYLADTLNDFILKPRLRSPILVIYGNSYDLYIEKFVKMAGRDGKDYFLANKLMPYKFRVSYIAKPATVKYSEDVAGDNVDCDLPESLHIDILKHAVDLYRTSISNNLYGAQQQDGAQQQELARNVARPTNDGYQN